MAQIKIYGIREHLDPIKPALSDAIHSCIVEALQFPRDKRAHRFFPMDSADFHYPASASLDTPSSRSACSKAALWRRRRP